MTVEDEAREVPGFPGVWAYPDGKIERRKIIKGTPARKDGYLRLSVSVGGGPQRTVMLHKLVALTFLGPRPPGLVTRHLNGDCTDNRSANLAYGTHAQNMQDKVRHGRSGAGESNTKAKLTEAQVASIRKSLSEGVSGARLSRDYGVCPTTITNIRNRKTWRHVR